MSMKPKSTSRTCRLPTTGVMAKPTNCTMPSQLIHSVRSSLGVVTLTCVRATDSMPVPKPVSTRENSSTYLDDMEPAKQNRKLPDMQPTVDSRRTARVDQKSARAPKAKDAMRRPTEKADTVRPRKRESPPSEVRYGYSVPMTTPRALSARRRTAQTRQKSIHHVNDFFCMAGEREMGGRSEGRVRGWAGGRTEE